MLDQIENLRSQIKSAMREYESLFTENKPMPEHRCIDIVDLRIILDRHYDDLSSCIDAVKQRLSIIKTGWWIFKTGRSRLRHGITPILQAYENPITQQLVTQILGISQSLNDVVEELRESRSGKIPILSINHQSPVMEKLMNLRTMMEEAHYLPSQLRKESLQGLELGSK